MSISRYVSSIGVRYDDRYSAVRLHASGCLCRIEFALEPHATPQQWRMSQNNYRTRTRHYRELGAEIARWIAEIGRDGLGNESEFEEACDIYNRHESFIRFRKFARIVNSHLDSEWECVECEHCSQIRPSGTVEYVNDSATCAACRQHCAECIVCRDEFFLTGEEETATIRRYGRDVEGIVCSSCRENGCTPDDGAYWTRYDDMHQHSDGLWYTYEEDDGEPEEDTSGVQKYHAGKCCRLDATDISIGFELEIRPRDTVDDDSLARELKSVASHLRCERDASITGFEVITGYGKLSTIETQAKAICDVLKGKATGHDAGTGYGLHVTVTRTDSASDENRMLLFWNDVCHERLLKAFTRRDPNTYCAKHHIRKLDVSTTKALITVELDKYKIINLVGKRLEIRWFRSTVKIATLLACLRLAYYSWEFCRDYSIDTTHLTMERFLTWCDDKAKTDPNYNTIRSYLAAKELI